MKFRGWNGFIISICIFISGISFFIYLGQGRNSLVVRAQEDEAEGEEADEGVVEDEDGGSEVENEEEGDDAAEAEAESNKNVHKDAETMLLFTKPSIVHTFDSGSVELPAGKVRKWNLRLKTV